MCKHWSVLLCKHSSCTNLFGGENMDATSGVLGLTGACWGKPTVRLRNFVGQLLKIAIIKS